MGIAPKEWSTRSLALVALGREEAAVARYLHVRLAHASLHVHALVPEPEENLACARGEVRFERIADEIAKLFSEVRGIAVFAPLGVTVRSLGPLLQSKLTDPAVVGVDAMARHVVSLLSGHEGGANALTMLLAELLDAEPVITTTTEAVKCHVVGVGCRRGTGALAIVDSVEEALSRVGLTTRDVRWLVSAEVKRDEPGLLAAAERLGLTLRWMSNERLRRWALTDSERVRQAVGLPAVAEPAALLAGTRTQCLMSRTVFRPGVTIAIARETLPWSGSAPVVGKTEHIAPSVRSPART
ncbi:MAG: cobalamin biosynthesis protein [Polyangiaceae bacterium]